MSTDLVLISVTYCKSLLVVTGNALYNHHDHDGAM